MRPKKGIKKLEFKWRDCRLAFSDKPPLFSMCGGAYEAFGFSNIWYYQKHFYFCNWCFLTIHGVR